jgi:hypothetical protein
MKKDSIIGVRNDNFTKIWEIVVFLLNLLTGSDTICYNDVWRRGENWPIICSAEYCEMIVWC